MATADPSTTRTKIRHTNVLSNLPGRTSAHGRETQQRLPTLLIPAAIIAIGLVGAGVPWLMRSFVGQEWLILAGLCGLGPLLFLVSARYDLFTWIAFCLLGVVHIEPAPVDALSMLLLLVGLLMGWISTRSLHKSKLIHVSMTVLLALNLLSMWVTAEFAESLRYLVITVYLIAFAYWVRMYVTTPQAMRTVLHGYLIGALLSTLLVVLGYLGIGPAETFVKQNRAVALFKDSNVFGPYLIPIVILLVDETWRPRMLHAPRALKVLCATALSGAVFFSFSRAAWGNLVVSLLIYLALNVSEISFRQALGLFLAAVLGGVLLVVTVQALDLVSFVRWRAMSFQTYDSIRFARQAAGFEAGLTHPLGIGPGMLYYAHSLYARTFAEYGVLGFVSLLCVLLTVFGSTLVCALRSTDPPLGLSPKVLTACNAGLLLNSFVIDTLHWRHLWLIWALSWATAASLQPGPILTRRRDRLDQGPGHNDG